MHHEITFDKTETFVTIRTSGELTFEGHRLFLDELIAHPEWKPGTDVLVDHRAASLAAITLDDIKSISLLVKLSNEYIGSGGRCAIILSDNAEFTKVAMWKVITAQAVGFKIEYFDSFEDGKKWLCEGR